MGSEEILVSAHDFLTLAKRYGFKYANLARLLQYSLTASGLDMNFSRRVKYEGVEPFHILFVGPLALPVSPVIHISRKSATDPEKAFTHAYELSRGGIDFKYLPPLDLDLLDENGIVAGGHYAVWIYHNGQRVEG